MLRPHPKYSVTDSDNPQAWGSCDRCGFQWPLRSLKWQFDYRGSSQLQNTRFLVCPNHYDEPNPQLSPVILSPDPPPLYNTRAENYALDETDWLTTQDGNIIDTQSGDSLTPTIPNPSSNANTAHLASTMSYPGGSVSAVYLDLFNGNPQSGGVSVLSAITGSSVRTNIAKSLTVNGSNVAVNPDVILIAAESLAQVNISYAAIYSASISGSLLARGTLSVVGQTIAIGTQVQFDALDLSINLS